MKKTIKLITLSCVLVFGNLALNAQENVNDLLSNIKKELAPDSRVAIFDIKADEVKGNWVLKGKVDTKVLKQNTLKKLDEKGVKYVHDNKLDSGLYYLYKSLTYPAQGNGYSIRNLYIAVAYQKKGELDSAKHYVDETLRCPNGIRQRSGCYNLLWSIAREEKDTLAMSRYSSKLVAYKDSILRLENQAAREVVKLNNSSHETMKRMYLRSYFLWGAIFVGVLLCVFVLLDYERRRQSQRAEERLTQTVDSLQAKLDEDQNRKSYDRKAIEEQLLSLKHSVVESGIMQSIHLRSVNQESSHRYFYALMDKMCLSFPVLTERELQICMLVLMQMNNEEMSKILFLSPNSIGKTKQRVAQRLGTSAGQLREFLLQYIS